MHHIHRAGAIFLDLLCFCVPLHRVVLIGCQTHHKAFVLKMWRFSEGFEKLQLMLTLPFASWTPCPARSLAVILQAATKLLLAEGSKFVMVASQSSYSQGIYGLVSNLGSLVVRTIFQVQSFALVGQGHPVFVLPWTMIHSVSAVIRLVLPLEGSVRRTTISLNHAFVHVQPFEEAAFLAFSQQDSGLSREASSRRQAKELSIAVRCVSLVGEYSLRSVLFLWHPRSQAQLVTGRTEECEACHCCPKSGSLPFCTPDTRMYV